MTNITTIHNEAERGCGFRKNGLYLRFDGVMTSCGKLPLPLAICPCCGEGVKQARSPRRINPQKLFGTDCCGASDKLRCQGCPAGPGAPEKALLLWIGEAHYPSIQKFTEETAIAGISRRINAVPRDFQVGEDYVFLAHPKAVWGDLPPKPDPQMQLPDMPPPAVEQGLIPGVFSMFRPTRIEYVISGKENEAELERLAARGLTLIRLTWDAGKGPQEKQKKKKAQSDASGELFNEDQQQAADKED